MKTKPILLLAAAAIIMVACGFLLIRGKKLPSPQSDEVVQYLISFKKHFADGESALLNYFKEDSKVGLYEILTILSGSPTDDYGQKINFNVEFNADKTTVKFIDSGLAVATVPITFSRQGFAQKYSFVYFTIQKGADHQYRINKLDGVNFMTAYQNYGYYVEENQYPDKKIYTPITIKAFAEATRLRNRYDSVVWFSHVNGKNWFYVTNGKWDVYKALWNSKDTAKTYKMGLLNPQFKQVIPANFDLVHNIGGTLPNLVEVEKNHKKGLYDLTGKVIVPVIYDQVMPVTDTKNLAALRKGDDFYWLRNDQSISGRVNLRIADVFSKLKQSASFILAKNPGSDILEFNSRRMHQSVYLPPSYLVDLQLTPAMLLFKNPIRPHAAAPTSTDSYEAKKEVKRTIDINGGGNWLTSIFYNIREYYLAGRLGFYTAKNLVIIDEKRNNVYGAKITDNIVHGDELNAFKNHSRSSIKALNDSLLEVISPAYVNINLYNDDVLEYIPVFHYFKIENRHLIEQDSRREFGFTRYRKIDDSYINGYYGYRGKSGDHSWQATHLNQNALQYMKNEIYASYNYNFKDSTWMHIFRGAITGYKPKNANVDDSLTAIDKYNINFINSKLHTGKQHTLAAK